jgi:hypothetical protein
MQIAEKNGDMGTQTVHCQIGMHHFRITEIGVRDQAEVLRLFVAAFGHSPDTGWYAWKYDFGRGEAIGLWNDNGYLAAHYAGFPRELRWQGTPVQAIQIGDVMVAPEVRGLLTRKGPFFQVCSRFFASRVGLGKSYRLAFGFPNERAIRLGVMLGLYHDAGIIQQISWLARLQKLPIGWCWTPLSKEKNPTWQIEHAWQSMSKDFTDYVLGVRDADYLNYRFLNRPDRKYQLFCLRRWPWGNAVAVAVMHVEPGRAELLDVIGARAAFSMVVRATKAEAARAGATALTAWASPAALAVFEESGVEIMGKAANLAVARASALTDREMKDARWWWMGGDTDFL